MIRICVWLILILLVAACNWRGQDTAPTPGPLAPDRPPSRLATEGGTSNVTIYLPRWFEDDTLSLRAVSRTVSGDDLPRAIVQALIRGPNGDERAASFEYPFDPRTTVVALRRDQSSVVVELSDELQRVIGRPYSELVYWSLVYSLTEAPGIERVGLERGGQPLLTFGYPPVAIAPAAGRDAAPDWARPR